LNQPNVLGLINKVAKAFDEKGGASTEYQTVQSDLQALKKTLQLLQSLKPDDANVTHVDAIRSMALAFQIPLQEFMHSIGKYETSLGASAMPKANVRSFGRKTQWALAMGKEISKLETAIRWKVRSIDQLLAIHTLESLSGLGSKVQENHVALVAKIIEQRMALADIERQTSGTKELVERHAREQTRTAKELGRKVDDVNANVERLSNNADAWKTELMSFTNLGAQLVHMIHHLPHQVCETLRQIVRSNLEIYSMLQVIHARIPRSPTYDQVDLFQFEDVLGRTTRLPYTDFGNKKTFNAFLRARFEGVPGEMRVSRGQYLILDANSEKEIISDEEWPRRVFPNSRLVMSIFTRMLARSTKEVSCPRPKCGWEGQHERVLNRFIKW
jgi:hypothetical protein